MFLHVYFQGFVLPTPKEIKGQQTEQNLCLSITLHFVPFLAFSTMSLSVRTKKQTKAAKAKKSAKIASLRGLKGNGVPGTSLATRGFSGSFGKRSGEKKVFDLAASTYNVSVASTAILLFAPQRGADYNQRVGRKTAITSLYIRGFINLENATNMQTTNTPAGQARLIVFIDWQPNGNTPTTTALLVTANPIDQLNLDNRDRFKIIADKTFEFEPFIISNGFSISNRSTQRVKLYKRMGLETIFNDGNDGDIGDINSGALYMLWIGNWANTTNLRATAHVSTRCRFEDA